MIRAFDSWRPALPAPRGSGTYPAGPAAPAATWGVDLLVRSAPAAAGAPAWRQELDVLQASITDLRARLDALIARPATTPEAVAPPPAPAEASAPHPAPAQPGAGPLIAQGASGDAVAKLQDRLRELGSDPGGTDGAFGPLTDAAVRDFQARNGLAVDGVVGPATWGALGIVVEAPPAPPPPAPAPAPAPGRGPLLRPGAGGPAVVALQDRLRALGHDPGGSDGAYGPMTEAAVRAFQAARGLDADGVVGPATWGALGIVVDAPAAPPPGAVGEPIAGWRGKVSQHFGGRHPGLDIAVPSGTPIQAAKAGVVVYAQFNPGGYGNLAILRHGDGTFTMYAHQSALRCQVGQAVQAGQVIGAVGSTGNSTGPHLHFEVRRGGEVWSAPTIDPEAYLGGH